jgi:bifunctional non-homologous end joining protein LigD
VTAAGARGARCEREVDVDGRRLRLTSLDKVLWPRTGFTKGEMVDYYRRIAPLLVPHLAGRPVTLGRFPDGVEGPGFAQTECRGRPDWLRTRALRLRSGQTRRFCLVDEDAALLWVANLGTIELHPYLGGGPDGEQAVLVLFDLDPGPPAGLLDAARVALRLRDTLARLGLAAFVKTSGASGLHVVVPLGEPHPYEAVSAFAAGIAGALESAHPGEVSQTARRAGRAGRVLVDWRQNHPRRSTIAPYSLRATPWPLVSAPVDWPEIEDAVAAGAPEALVFPPAAVLDRAERLGDLHAPVLARRQRLPG